MDGSAIFVLHTTTHTLLLQLDHSLLSVLRHQINWYMLLLFNRYYIKSSSMHNHSFITSLHKLKNKKSTYKNTVIQQKDSIATCPSAQRNGSMHWLDKDITGESTSLPGQTAPTDGRESTWRILGASLRCLLSH